MGIINIAIENNINVKQALEWLAMGWLPYSGTYERLASDDRNKYNRDFDGEKIDKINEHFYSSEDLEYNQNMYKAVALLEYLINKKIIKLYSSSFSLIYSRYNNHVKDQESYDFHKVYSDKILWFNAQIIFGNNNYLPLIDIDCSFDFSSLHLTPEVTCCIRFDEIKNYSINDFTNAGNDSGDYTKTIYTTPYLTLLNTMIKKGYVSKDNQPLADNLKEDIKKEAKLANIEISDRIAASMATILRLPEMKKGGCKKMKG